MSDARSVACTLGIRHFLYNFTGQFEEHVMKRFVDAYENGCTPNPCIDCNRYIKFQELYERAKLMGYDIVVTGHYARVEYNEVNRSLSFKEGIRCPIRIKAMCFYRSYTGAAYAHTVSARRAAKA